jgi:hypothetical protein
MSTIQTTLKPTRTRWISTVVVTAGALIAVGVTVVFLALTGAGRTNHPMTSHPAATYYPLIQYRGTGSPPATAARTRPTTPTAVSPRKSYGAVP